MRYRLLNLYAGGVILLWTMLISAVLAFNATQIQQSLYSWSTSVDRFLLPAVLIAIAVWVLCANLTIRIVAANLLLAITAAAYAGEFLLAHRLVETQQATPNFDPRNKLTVIRDLRQSNANVYPIVRAENMLTDSDDHELKPILVGRGGPLLPLASIPNTRVVSCNESGEWQIYDADHHGFNNPDHAWDQSPDIGIVGDSFAHGSCVPREQGIAGRLRGAVGNVLNVAVGGFGPLLELAALTEYLQPTKPRTVLWVFFEGNDLTEDLPSEMRAPILRRYLSDPRFNQNLIHRSTEIRDVMRHYLDRELATTMARVDDPWEDALRYLSLDRVREKFGVGHLQIGYNAGNLTTELTDFERIIREANRRVATWGGKLYLVYLPESARYAAHFTDSSVRSRIYTGVQDVARRSEIPLIDVAAAFGKVAAANTLYAYPGAHCNARGYQLVAQTITEALGEHRDMLTSNNPK